MPAAGNESRVAKTRRPRRMGLRGLCCPRLGYEVRSCEGKSEALVTWVMETLSRLVSAQSSDSPARVNPPLNPLPHLVRPRLSIGSRDRLRDKIDACRKI